jgi:hypothetical protein
LFRVYTQLEASSAVAYGQYYQSAEGYYRARQIHLLRRHQCYLSPIGTGSPEEALRRHTVSSDRYRERRDSMWAGHTIVLVGVDEISQLTYYGRTLGTVNICGHDSPVETLHHTVRISYGLRRITPVRVLSGTRTKLGYCGAGLLSQTVGSLAYPRSGFLAL